mmetsp:Transcript_7346/g.12642  ORF Transcript_7346/g.12642 Transcript_7346/m.12642 type:complete len:391 (-) Transcript_7346:202-1374(-)
MDEGILVGWHSFIFDSFHHPKVAFSVRIRDDIHCTTASSFLGCEDFLTRALFEVGALAINHENTNIDALSLQLRLACFLQCIDIGHVCLCNTVDIWAIGILNHLPFHFAFFVFKWIKSLGHRLNDFTWFCLDKQLPAVKMCNVHLKPTQSLHERDVSLNEEVCALSLELLVLLLLANEYDVTCVSIWMLICHLPKRYLVTIRRALLDMHLENFAVLLCPKALALAAARVASRLHLLDHRPHADDLNLHTATAAFRALLHALLFVNDLACDGHLFCLTVVHLLESHLDWLHYVFGFLASPSTTATSWSTTTTKESIKDISGITTRTVTINSFLTEPIILFTLVPVAENFICTSDLLEFLRVATLVRMVLHCQLPISLLDFCVTCILVNLQQ